MMSATAFSAPELPAYVDEEESLIRDVETLRVGLDVLDSAKDCPGNCIHVRRAADGVLVAGPDA